MSLETEIFTEHNSQQGTIHQLDGSTAIGERRYQRHRGNLAQNMANIGGWTNTLENMLVKMGSSSDFVEWTW